MTQAEQDWHLNSLPKYSPRIIYSTQRYLEINQPLHYTLSNNSCSHLALDDICEHGTDNDIIFKGINFKL